MAMIREKSVSVPTKLSNVVINNNSDFGELLGLLSDKQTLLVQRSSWNSSTLGVSVDGGVTFKWGSTLGSGGIYKIVGFIETPKGEILIATGQKSTSSPGVGNVWRSTGWNKKTATATSWNIVTSSLGTNVQYDGRWGFNERCVIREGELLGAIVIAEYGAKVSDAITDGNTADYGATKVKISYDDGITWEVIFDLAKYFPNSSAIDQLHVHGCAIDHEFQRVMVTYGDGGFDGKGESGIVYCNFEDLNSPIWQTIQNTNGRNPRNIQVTTIHCAKNRIELISDSEVGAIRIINRVGYRVYGEMKNVVNLRSGAIGANIYTDISDKDAPRLMTYQIVGSNTGHKPAIYRVSDDEIYEIYRSDIGQTSGRGIVNAVGPDINGKIYATVQLGGVSGLLSSTYMP